MDRAVIPEEGSPEYEEYMKEGEKDFDKGLKRQTARHNRAAVNKKRLERASRSASRKAVQIMDSLSTGQLREIGRRIKAKDTAGAKVLLRKYLSDTGPRKLKGHQAEGETLKSITNWLAACTRKRNSGRRGLRS